MAGARHLQYTVILVGILVTTFYLLLFRVNRPSHLGRYVMRDSTLPSRMERAHYLYNKLLAKRPELIKQFGPEPRNISVFPANKPPYPPYTVWDFFPAAFNCPHEVERHGALGDGGKWVCGLSRLKEKTDCVVYSFGINYESSFEAAILDNTRHCKIWGYDFSVKSFGPEIPESQIHRTHFKAVGLSGSDAHGPDDHPPMYTLESLMKQNGHQFIEILKIDIEGWEFETITTLLQPYIDSGRPLPFGQLQLEIHLWRKPFEEFLEWWEKLEAAGLRPFFTEPNLVYLIYNKQHTPDLAEYSFLNVKGHSIFIEDPV